jgi:hypothetical protein
MAYILEKFSDVSDFQFHPLYEKPSGTCRKLFNKYHFVVIDNEIHTSHSKRLMTKANIGNQNARTVDAA